MIEAVTAYELLTDDGVERLGFVIESHAIAHDPWIAITTRPAKEDAPFSFHANANLAFQALLENEVRRVIRLD